MDEQQIVKTLIDMYKEQGIDLYAVIDDPLFGSLSTDQKIKTLKQFASHINSGTSRALTKRDIHSILIDASLGAAYGASLAGTGAFSALAYYTKGKIPLKPILASAAIGGGLTALGTLIHANRLSNQRTQIGERLDNLQQDNTDQNALKVLITRNQQVSPNRNVFAPSSINTTVSNILQKMPSNIISRVSPYAKYKTMEFNERNDTPYATGKSSDQIDAAVADAHAKVYNYGSDNLKKGT